MKNFYHNDILQIKLNGTEYEGFQATRRIRQGCPLSPLILAIVNDSLSRVLQTETPTAQLCNFADDTAALLPSWTRQAKNSTQSWRRTAE